MRTPPLLTPLPQHRRGPSKPTHVIARLPPLSKAAEWKSLQSRNDPTSFRKKKQLTVVTSSEAEPYLSSEQVGDAPTQRVRIPSRSLDVTSSSFTKPRKDIKGSKIDFADDQSVEASFRLLSPPRGADTSFRAQHEQWAIMKRTLQALEEQLLSEREARQALEVRVAALENFLPEARGEGSCVLSSSGAVSSTEARAANAVTHTASPSSPPVSHLQSSQPAADSIMPRLRPESAPAREGSTSTGTLSMRERRLSTDECQPAMSASSGGDEPQPIKSCSAVGLPWSKPPEMLEMNDSEVAVKATSDSEAPQGQQPKHAIKRESSKSLLVNRHELDARGSTVTVAHEMEATEEYFETFDQSLVGIYSCHGAEDGHGKINQDAGCLSHPLARTPGCALFCVYDGHGKCGHDVSQEVLHSMHDQLEARGMELCSEPELVLAESFHAVNLHLGELCESEEILVDARDSGACALVAHINRNELCVAGAGDCRAVLGTCENDELTAIALSTDHKCDLPLEQLRIEQAGGYVRPAVNTGDDFAPARLYEDKRFPWKGPGLAIARGLGDLNSMRCGMIPTPEVTKRKVTSEDKFLIMASDGLWEFISNADAVNFVDQFYSKGKPAIEACRYLIARAALAWRENEGDYRDDITAIVVYLPSVVKALEREVDRSPVPKHHAFDMDRALGRWPVEDVS